MSSEHTPHVSRAVSGSTVDDVLAAVMGILVESGPDAVHLAAVASLADVSVEDIDETFGHPGELLHLAWDRELRLAFDLLVSEAAQLMSIGLSAMDHDEATSPKRRAAVHLLVVAHRFDELREVIPFDVQRILYNHEHQGIDDLDRSTLRALIGWLMGVALEPGHRYSDSLSLLELIEWRPGCWRGRNELTSVEETPPLPLVFDEIGDMSQEILGACTRIIAQGGLARATLLRIARMAGYPPEVVQGMYGRSEHLIAQYLKLSFDLLFSYRRFEQLMSAPAVATMRLDVWLGPNLQTRRRALLESLMASNFAPFQESAFGSAADEALADLCLDLLDRPEREVIHARHRFMASRQIALGLAVLEDVELEKVQRDWGPFLQVFLTEPD